MYQTTWRQTQENHILIPTREVQLLHDTTWLIN